MNHRKCISISQKKLILVYLQDKKDTNVQKSIMLKKNALFVLPSQSSLALVPFCFVSSPLLLPVSFFLYIFSLFFMIKLLSLLTHTN